jgi:hypothetical protein
VANAGDDQTVYETNLVQLDGSASSDFDDGIFSYRWEQTEGTPMVTLDGLNEAVSTFTAPDIGPAGAALTFQLTVSDYSGLQSTDTCIVNVTWTNEAPTADAGPYQTDYEGHVVTLDGSGSMDPDDGIASYQWQHVGGPPTVALMDADTPQVRFIAPDTSGISTSLTLELTVTDYGGLQDTDTTIVDILPRQSPATKTGTVRDDNGGGGGGGGGGCFVSTLADVYSWY